MPKSGGEMEIQPQAAEQIKGLQMEELTAETLPQYDGIIKAMRYNALDTSKNLGLQAAREKQVDRLPHTYLREGQHGGLFVMKDGERVVGFVALRVEPQERLGVVEHIWQAEHHGQGKALAEMVHTSERYFRDHNCDHGLIKASKESRELQRITGRTDVERFFTVEDSDESDERAVGENGQ